MQKLECRLCRDPLDKSQAIITSLNGVLEQIPVCRVHQKREARRLVRTGEADFAFIPLPEPRQF
jgi:hypothetical protein